MCSATLRKQKKTQKGTTPTSSLTTQYVDSKKCLMFFLDCILYVYISCFQYLKLFKTTTTAMHFIFSRQSSEKFDVTSRPLSKADTFEDTDVDGQPPESFLVVRNLSLVLRECLGTIMNLLTYHIFQWVHLFDFSLTQISNQPIVWQRNTACSR